MKDSDFFKIRHGKTLEVATRIPTIQETIDKARMRLKSAYGLRTLGMSQESGEVNLREEERESHMHIIGTTGEGKSKLLEHLIREDIRRGNGVCFLDPTDRAETAYNILRYCASIGHKKVCLIDPHTIDTHNRVTCIQPFTHRAHYQRAVVSNLMDTVRVLFNQKDSAETPKIQRYLSSIFYCLWNAEMTLHEAIYFSDYKHHTAQRKAILEASDTLDRHRLALEEALQTYYRFDKDLSSSVRRLEPFFESTLDLMLGADKGIDFAKMIADRWVILVNLDAEGGFEPIHSRLLGTTVINELLFAMHRLIKHNRKYGKKYNVPYYLYIDEAGQYVNDKLIRILEYKRKSNFRVTLAHQGFWQFPKDKMDAVKQLTKIKVMFNTPNHSDRLEMVKALGYGGDIPFLEANYVNADLPKQYAIIKKGKQPPRRFRVADVPAVNLNPKAEQEYINQILLNEWNFHPEDVREQMERRFNDYQETRDTKPPGKRTKANSRPNIPTVFD